MTNKSLIRSIFVIVATASMALTSVVAKQKNQPAPDKGREVSVIENGNSKVAKQQGRRIALLIGNSRYSKLPALSNPKNDVALMQATLRELGFTEIIGGTQRGLDLSYADMQELLEEFSKKSSSAEVAVIFFAGHGLVTKLSNEQYLAGTETTGQENRLPAEAMSINAIMDKLSNSGAEKNFVFLDACRTSARRWYA